MGARACTGVWRKVGVRVSNVMIEKKNLLVMIRSKIRCGMVEREKKKYE